MIRGENDKGILLIYPQSKTAAATAEGTVDTVDYDLAQIDILLDTAATNPTGCVLQEGAASNSFTSITEAVGDTAWIIPAIDTSNGCIIRMNVDLKKRKRYLNLEVTPGATQLVAAICRLSRAHETPVGATAQAYDYVLNI